MNKINFTARNNFPLSSDAMEMLQQMILLSAQSAVIGGYNCILSGCTDDGAGNVSDGVVVIDGELLSFQGGVKKSKVVIEQTSQTLSALGENYPEAYVFRLAKFSDNGTHNWDDLTRILTNKQIEDRINSLKGEEPGFVKMWSGRVDRIPADYMLCNGDTLQTSEYPNLAHALGRETESSFVLPDLRRRFIVGYDNAQGSDYRQMWDTGGEEKVTLTLAEMPKHSHDIHFKNERWGDDANSRPFPDQTGSFATTTTEAGENVAHENRPPYFVLAYVIKVK